MGEQGKPVDLKRVLDEAGGYAPACYPFISDGLAYTVRLIHGEGAAADDESRHVSGQQLCMGLRDYAVQRYGLLAKVVLNRWGVYETADFGRIIFAMVDAGLMNKTDEDTIADFDAVYDFDEAFQEPEPTHSA